MSENYKSLLIINDADELPSESISLPLKWNGLDVTYLSTATSSYPIHNHRAVQIIIPLRTSGFGAVTLSAISSREKFQKLTSETNFGKCFRNSRLSTAYAFMGEEQKW